MITAMVRDRLAASPIITALVGARVYVDGLPTTPDLPAISVHPVSRVPDADVGKGYVSRVQISCWSNPPVSGGVRSPGEVETVAAAVIAVMHKPRVNMVPERWTLGSMSYDVTTRQVTGGVRRIEDPMGWYHVPIDVRIIYREI